MVPMVYTITVDLETLHVNITIKKFSVMFRDAISAQYKSDMVTATKKLKKNCTHIFQKLSKFSVIAIPVSIWMWRPSAAEITKSNKCHLLVTVNYYVQHSIILLAIA